MSKLRWIKYVVLLVVVIGSKFFITMGKQVVTEECQQQSDTALKGCEITAVSVNRQLSKCEHMLQVQQQNIEECSYELENVKEKLNQCADELGQCGNTLMACDEAFTKCVTFVENLFAEQ